MFQKILFPSVFVIFFCFSITVKVNSQSISISKTIFNSYETIDVYFSNLDSTKKNWIGLRKIDSKNNLGYSQIKNLETTSQGKVSFTGYLSGEYVVQLFLDWPKQGYNIKDQINIEFQSELQINDSIVQYPTKQLKQNWKKFLFTDYEPTIDYEAEMAATISAKWIFKGFSKENNSTRFARLEAALKRKILQSLISKGLFKDASLPPITEKEVNLIAKEYEKLDNYATRWRLLDAIWKGLLYLTEGEGTFHEFINNRLIHSFHSEKFMKILSPISSPLELKEVFDFTFDIEGLKDSWMFQFHNFETYKCDGYSIWSFKNYLTAKTYEKIENLNSQEKRFFIYNDLLPPLFPPWKLEINKSCIKY